MENTKSFMETLFGDAEARQVNLLMAEAQCYRFRISILVWAVLTLAFGISCVLAVWLNVLGIINSYHLITMVAISLFVISLKPSRIFPPLRSAEKIVKDLESSNVHDQ
jgi:hypothetical protein